ncbi:hypothetical protein [Halovenus salina]|uniref:DUF8135 domain-containing protein n=1 Tax=Halovenus salina TaxID=1510225 RepID=A0ABD5W5P2_9EURY|nr:hypothetical protein [Halovenus salina]
MSDDDTSDLFEDLEADVADREGDPFESLSDAAPEEPADEQAAETGEDDQSDEVWGEDFEIEEGPPESPGVERAKGAQTDEAVSDSSTALDDDLDRDGMDLNVGRRPDTESDPLGDVRPRQGDPFEENDSLFEERETEGIDPDTVWQDLASADARGAAGEYERTFAEVSKHAYCEQCEHFSPPPDVACAHEGTDIVEFLDMETVRVVDCPIVAEREELQEE